MAYNVTDYVFPFGESDHDKLDLLYEKMKQSQKPLSEDALFLVPDIELTSQLLNILWQSHKSGKVLRGMDYITEFLEREAKGLEKLKKQPGSHHGQKVTRLLLVACDSANRFKHQISRLLETHFPRVFACFINLTGTELGQSLYSGSGIARVILISDKEALSRFLMTYLAIPDTHHANGHDTIKPS